MASTPVGSHGSEPLHQLQVVSANDTPSPVSKGRGATLSKKVCMSMGGPQKAPSPAAAGKMNTPVIPRGQSSAKEVWVTSKAVQELSTNAFQHFVQLHSSHM